MGLSDAFFSVGVLRVASAVGTTVRQFACASGCAVVIYIWLACAWLRAALPNCYLWLC